MPQYAPAPKPTLNFDQPSWSFYDDQDQVLSHPSSVEDAQSKYEQLTSHPFTCAFVVVDSVQKKLANLSEDLDIQNAVENYTKACQRVAPVMELNNDMSIWNNGAAGIHIEYFARLKLNNNPVGLGSSADDALITYTRFDFSSNTAPDQTLPDCSQYIEVESQGVQNFKSTFLGLISNATKLCQP